MNKETDMQNSVRSKVNVTFLNDLLIPTNHRYPTMYFNVKRIKNDLVLTVGYRQYSSFHIRVKIPLDMSDTNEELQNTLNSYIDKEHVEDYIIVLDLLMKREKTFVDYYAAKHRVDAIDTAIAHVTTEYPYVIDICSDDEFF